MSDNIYCGNGKIIKTQFGNQLKLSLTAEDVQTLQANLDNGWVNIDVKKKRDENVKFPYYLEVNTWKPNQQSTPEPPAYDEEEPLPF
jgi:hypothetical protein